MKIYKFHRWLAAMLLLLLGSVSLPIFSTEKPKTQSIVNYVLVSKTKINRSQYDLNYQAQLKNRGSTAVAGATAVLTKVPKDLKATMVDGQLQFGAVGPEKRL
ncbi:MAG: hypothetical protein HOP23_12325 [Methylococcaceae bacterium]|nr:hypothetical protein [Methylococcaceae bacterium]